MAQEAQQSVLDQSSLAVAYVCVCEFCVCVSS